MLKNLMEGRSYAYVDGVLSVDDGKPLPTEVEISLELMREDVSIVIQEDYRTLLIKGVTYNGSTFQSGAASITALNEVLTAIANGWGIPANFAWIDSADVPHVADLTFLKGLAIALADHKSALFARLQVAKAALRSATTQAEIEAITL